MEKLVDTRLVFLSHKNLLYLQNEIIDYVNRLIGLQIKAQNLSSIKGVCNYVWYQLWESSNYLEYYYMCDLNVLNNEAIKILVPHIINQLFIQKKYLTLITNPPDIMAYPIT